MTTIPIYLTIKEQLYQSIRAGAYAGDVRIPSERELAQKYGVSRMTARQALRALAQEGYVYTRTGVGTFARQTPVHQQQLQQLTSFSEDARQRGLSVHSQVFKAEILPASEDIATALHLAIHEPIILLKRLRFVENMPLAIETSHLKAAAYPDLLSQYDFQQESLYQVLTEKYGCQFAWADQTIFARSSTPEERQYLGINAQIPVLAMTRLTYNPQQHPIEFVRSVYRSDQYQLHAILYTAGYLPPADAQYPPTGYVTLRRIVETEATS